MLYIALGQLTHMDGACACAGTDVTDNDTIVLAVVVTLCVVIFGLLLVGACPF